MDDYNGYSGRERDRKYQEYKRLRALGLSVPAVPPCQLCGDPESPVEPHSEDYSMPYLWSPPAEYMICRSCHGWIHKRFNRPDDWRDFQAHVRRGGYAREFSGPGARKERDMAAEARGQGGLFEWAPTAGRSIHLGQDWWDHLTMLPDSLNSPLARPRP
jgi:hypothetical protein